MITIIYIAAYGNEAGKCTQMAPMKLHYANEWLNLSLLGLVPIVCPLSSYV